MAVDGCQKFLSHYYVYDVFLSSSNLLGFEFDDKKKAKDVTAGYLDYNTTI